MCTVWPVFSEYNGVSSPRPTCFFCASEGNRIGTITHKEREEDGNNIFADHNAPIKPLLTIITIN